MLCRFNFRTLNFVLVICVCIFVTLILYSHLNYVRCNMNNSRPQTFNDALLEMCRLMVKINMWNYNYSHSGVDKLEDLVMESGGTPVRSIIVTTWRSGSSFLGELINAAPASFYSYEPLILLGTVQITGPPLADRAVTLLKDILTCNYSKNNTISKEYISYAKTLNFQFQSNKWFWNACNIKKTLCFNANFLAKFCRLFPFHVVKLIRLRLPLLQTILEQDEPILVKSITLRCNFEDASMITYGRVNLCSSFLSTFHYVMGESGKFYVKTCERLNVKLVLLIRDPRGVMQSRKTFCNYGPCAVTSLCTGMIVDYNAVTEILHKYPDRLMVLRYEDLALNLNKTTLQLFKFLRLEPTRSVREFLDAHTNVTNPDTFSTFRVTKDIPFKWIKETPFSDVEKIQGTCKDAMSLWGYNLAHNQSHMESKYFYPLSPYRQLLAHGRNYSFLMGGVRGYKNLQKYRYLRRLYTDEYVSKRQS